MKILISILLIILSLGCTRSGSDTADHSISPPNPAPTLRNFITLTASGNNFDCFTYTHENNSNSLVCTGLASFLPSNSDILAITTVPINALYTRDDTLCVELEVTKRPESRTPGVSTYCFGEATLSATYQYFPLVYGGPNYSSVTNGSPEFQPNSEPFTGGDLTIDTLVNQTAYVPEILTDSNSVAAVASEACKTSTELLECESFSITLNVILGFNENGAQ